MNTLLTQSGTKLAEMIRNRDVTSREVVEVHIEQIKKVNPALNAVVKDRFTDAKREADQADEVIKNNSQDELPPFFGVPCTIKENLAHKGMPNTCGLKSREDIIASKDATVVSRLRSAGAVPLGVTNIPELCLWLETNNPVYGRCCNAYNQKLTSGGSSGGEGSIIGAGGSPLGLGSDIAGSIRGPAFFNGVFGHKPSGGLVSNTGQYPPVENRVKRFLTIGPIARSSHDLMPILKIISGPDGIDDSCEEITLGDPSSIKIKDLSVFSIDEHGYFPVSSELREAQKKCADYLEDKGARVFRNIRLAPLKKALEIWFSTVYSELGDPLEMAVTDKKGTGRIKLSHEIPKLFFRRSNHILPVLFFISLERTLTFLEKQKFAGNIVKNGLQKLVDAGSELREELKMMLGNDGIILYPSFSTVAPPHNHPFFTLHNISHMFMTNVMEFPGTQVPLGLNNQGIPLGVQVIGNYGQDHVTIGVAMELEKAFGGWVPPWKNN